MPKFVKTIISLTCVLLLCANLAHARRMSPAQVELMQKPAVVKASTAADDATALEKTGVRVWQPQVTDFAIWKALSKPVRDFEYLKFVLDLRSNRIYFVDSNVFLLHTDFVMDYLQQKPRTTENMRAYNQNYSTKKPQFILGYITHYPQIKAGTQSQYNGLWTLSFWEGDTITPKDIRRTHQRLQQTFDLAPLVFRPDSPAQEKVAAQLKAYKIATISNHKIYKSQPYQAFNTGVAVGRLNIVPLATKPENLQFAPDEIVVLQEAYPDISPVAGIITVKPSTPLAHVNLRAAAWGIPNAFDVKAAFFEELYFTQPHAWMRYEVTEQKMTLTPASAEDIAAAKTKQIKQPIMLPPADLSTQSLLQLSQISAQDSPKYGAKTANLGEMLQAGLPVPKGFGIPFYYYQQHVQRHGLDIAISKLLSQPKFSQDKAWRNQQLVDLQQKIKAAPINKQHLTAITAQWKTVLNNAPVFVRSSTNAEDLAGFNGAGLYDTVPNVTDEKALETAIKQVWASLWNARAVDERAFFGLAQDQMYAQVYASVLIQKAVNASAAGVLLTTDIWGKQAGTYTINAKWGLGLRVVEGQKIAEQILFDTSNSGTRVLSRSDETTMLVASPSGGMIEKPVPKAKVILTEKRAKQLAQLAQEAAELFNQTAVLDIEWVLENRAGKDTFWLVQARPYVKKLPNN